MNEDRGPSSVMSEFDGLIRGLSGAATEQAEAEQRLYEWLAFLVPQQVAVALQLIAAVQVRHALVAARLRQRLEEIMEKQFEAIGVAATVAGGATSNALTPPKRKLPAFAKKQPNVLRRERAIFETLKFSGETGASADDLVSAAQTVDADASRPQIMTFIGKLVKAGWIEGGQGIYRPVPNETNAYLEALEAAARLKRIE